MCKSEKIKFLDNVAKLFLKYCPQMSDDVRYWVACQFALESNFGLSRLVKTKLNYCGMKMPLSRPTLNICVSGDFAKFESLECCVIDYVYWLSWNHFNFVDLFHLNNYTRRIIASKYCPETDYVDRVYALYNSFINP